MINHSDVEMLLRDKYGGVKTNDFVHDVHRLENGEPLGYVIGWVPFLDSRIYLDSHPLIPRVETEFWVEKAIDRLDERTRNFENRLQILDIFAGSGAIGIALLMRLNHAVVDFGEIDVEHLKTIQKNIVANKINHQRSNLIQTDVWSNITSMYDYILANPPYLSESNIQRVQQSVLQYEPQEALFAKENGFSFIERTLSGLHNHLSPTGELWIEHEPDHEAALNNLAMKLGFLAETFKDQYGFVRYSVLRHKR